MRGNVGWKLKVGAYRLTIGCSTCKSSPQAAFDEWEHPPLNPLECGVAKPCVTANEDDPRRRCPKASKYGSRTKDHKGINEGANGRNIKRHTQSIQTLPSL